MARVKPRLGNYLLRDQVSYILVLVGNDVSNPAWDFFYCVPEPLLWPFDLVTSAQCKDELGIAGLEEGVAGRL
jgi:hypothetical protein